jgi:hypothetical protein
MPTDLPTDPIPTPKPDIVRPPTPAERPQPDLPTGIPEPGPDVVTPTPPREIPIPRPDEFPPEPAPAF